MTSTSASSGFLLFSSTFTSSGFLSFSSTFIVFWQVLYQKGDVDNSIACKGNTHKLWQCLSNNAVDYKTSCCASNACTYIKFHISRGVTTISMKSYCRPNLAQLSANMAQQGPILAQLGQSLSQLGSTSRQLAPTWSHLGATWLQLSPMVVPTWSNMVPKSYPDDLLQVFSSLSKRSSVFYPFETP